MRLFILALMLLAFGCDKSTDIGAGRNPIGSNPEDDPSHKAAIIKAYQELLDTDPVAMDASKVHQWPGLANIGNTCFMNASLKLLARQKEIFNSLKEITGEDPKKAEFRKSFKAVINMIRQGEQSKAHSISGLSKYALESFRDQMKNFNPLKNMTDCSQNDANEFVQAISQVLELEKDTPNNKVIKLTVQRKNNLTENAQLLPPPGILPVTKDSNMTEILNDFITHQWTGNELEKNSFESLDKSIILSVNATDYEKVLDAQGKVTGSKQVIRPFLVSTNNQDQINIKHLNNPPNLAALNGIDPASVAFTNALPKDSEAKDFNLAALVVHSGEPGGGHYWAYVKDENKGWIEHNDSSVSVYKGPTEKIGKIEERDTAGKIGKQVYMYLYEQPK